MAQTNATTIGREWLRAWVLALGLCALVVAVGCESEGGPHPEPPDSVTAGTSAPGAGHGAGNAGSSVGKAGAGGSSAGRGAGSGGFPGFAGTGSPDGGAMDASVDCAMDAGVADDCDGGAVE